MVDIRTTTTVTVDDAFRVAIAKDGDDYQAAVVGVRKSALGQAMESALSLGTEVSEWSERDDAPREIREARWVAVGAAVEAYLEAEYGDVKTAQLDGEN